MVKWSWLALAFATGIAVGVVATRMTDAPESEAKGMITPGAPHVMPPATPSEPAAVARPQPSAVAAATQPVDARDALGSDAVLQPNSNPAASAPEPATPDLSVPVQPIDAGEIFNKVIAQPSQHGFENSIGEAHRALEREPREDGWAYSMEAEIQNSMVTEVSTGAFRAEHVECRATMCELRLSGKGDQSAAIKRWSDELGSQPFGQKLLLNYASTISDNGRVDSLMIFRRPPKM